MSLLTHVPFRSTIVEIFTEHAWDPLVQAFRHTKRSGTFTGRTQDITCMPEYEDVSADELRLREMATPALVQAMVPETDRGTKMDAVYSSNPDYFILHLLLTDTRRAEGHTPFPNDLIRLIYAYGVGGWFQWEPY